MSRRLRIPQLSQTKTAVSAFFLVLTPSESDSADFLRVRPAIFE
jgi:hypothetical protein